MVSGLFRHIEQLQDGTPWGAVLDAGVGVNSAEWMTALTTSRWTAVTAAPGHARQVREAVGGRMREQDRLLVGNWMDPGLLAGEVHDVVLADYLIGAVEGFSPYFQEDLLRRLKPMVGRRLYITGLDPYVVGEVPDAAARCVREIGRVRDVCLLLADETPYREFPAEWVRDRLDEAGFRVLSARRFPNRYRGRWVDGQLNMALRRLPKIPDQVLARALADRIEALREEGHRLDREGDGLHVGFDYVIAAEPA